MQRDNTDCLAPSQSMAQLCRKWYKLTRKTRREHNWTEMYHKLFTWIFPDVIVPQLLIPPNDMLENFQLLLSASFTFHEIEADSQLIESPATDLILLLEGRLAYQDQRSNKQTSVVPFQNINPMSHLLSKTERTVFRVLQKSTLLKCERKLMDKFKNDILRQDRQNKQTFLSHYLFCNFTPVYTLSNLKLTYVKEGNQIQLPSNTISILYEGLVKRKNRNTKKCQGTELTRGCVLSYRLLSRLIDRLDWFQHQDEEILQAKLDCVVLIFDLDQMARILKLNATLKSLIQNKLKILSNQRQSLKSKSIQLQAKLAESFKQSNECIQLSYSIDFKTKPKSANPMLRSFRCKPSLQLSDSNYAQFISFDKYDKMMQSKQRVMTRKQTYQLYERRTRVVKTTHPPDYDKRMKLQNKMIRLQTGKIQKISQRDSRVQCSQQQMQQIKKNLFQITNLFDEPLKEVEVPIHQSKGHGRMKTSNQLQNCLQVHCIPRVSCLKPEEFLKNEYLHQFLSKSRTRYSLKDGLYVQRRDNKENLMQRTQCSSAANKAVTHKEQELITDID